MSTQSVLKFVGFIIDFALIVLCIILMGREVRQSREKHCRRAAMAAVRFAVGSEDEHNFAAFWRAMERIYGTLRRSEAMVLYDQRKEGTVVPYDYVSRLLKAGNTHWLYCSDCERWWFTNRTYCSRCESELEKPATEVLKEFMTEFLDFWNHLTDATARRPYSVRRLYTENEVAGLMWVQKRVATTRK